MQAPSMNSKSVFAHNAGRHCPLQLIPNSRTATSPWSSETLCKWQLQENREGLPERPKLGQERPGQTAAELLLSRRRL